jgi:hypothetical protein
VACGLLAVAGAVVSVLLLTPGEFVAVILIGGVMGAFTLWLSRTVPGDQRLPPATGPVETLENIALGAALSLSLALLSATWGASGSLFLIALVGAGAAVRAWGTQGSAPRTASAPHLVSWTTAELLLAWEHGTSLLESAGTAEERAEIVARRQGYLDELERRDHAGVERWLADPVPDGDPRRFISDPD